MARIVKEYDQRNEEILNTAQALFYKKGYTQTSIQDIINNIGIAKGTFYHYFDSKLDLLEALVEQLVAQSLVVFEALANDSSMDALTKMTEMFNLLGNWKTARKEQLTILIEALYRDENILLMHKIRERSIAAVTPTLTRVIEQGIEEGVFEVASAADSAEIFIRVSQGLSDAFGQVLLNPDEYDDPVGYLKRKKAAYEEALERVFNAPDGSFSMFDEAILTVWFD